MKLSGVAGVAMLASVSACASDGSAMPPPMPMAMVATLNGNDIVRDEAGVAPWHEEALCVHATDTLIAKGDWDFQKPISTYWNAQFTSHLPAESDRAPRMEDGRKRFAALQRYSDATSNLYLQIALVSRCERAMKAAG